ncbi:MAG TPA: Hpt domain-containing protein, partial [Kofleriaceae bacterium]|nr:Hpt domain-containing protein [Kofleriaceae bacterium]
MRAVSSEIIERFRSLSLERLARVESAWATLVRGGGGREIATEIARVVHTVKGDARVVGFADVNLVCHKLEDLLAAAAARDYRIPEDLDLMVTMAIQFASLLLRTEHGAAAGIDVAGFVRQVDDAVANTERQRALAPRVSRSPSTRASLLRVRAAPGIERLSAGAQHRLAAAAALVFLEHENATGSARARLLAAFRVLTAELSRLGHVPVSDILKVHVVAAGDLAQRLGKQA